MRIQNAGCSSIVPLLAGKYMAAVYFHRMTQLRCAFCSSETTVPSRCRWSDRIRSDFVHLNVTFNLFAAMAVVLLALVVTVEEVVEEESSAIPVNACGRNSGISMSSQSLRKTSINSTPTLPGGLWYVGSIALDVLCNTRNVLPPARVAVM